MLLFLDTETFSEIPINAGVHAYSQKGEVMLVAWAVDDAPVEVWDRVEGNPMPPLLKMLLEDEDTIVVIHNSHFDRTMLRNCMGIDIPVERIEDTMIQAFAHALPGKLGQLCAVLNVPVDKAKDQAGKNLIQLFCKPRPKNSKIRRATRHTHPEQWAKFVEYARLDVEAMRECRKRMPRVNLTEKERKLWFLDQKINDRGIAVDLTLVREALKATDIEQKNLKGQTFETTEGQLESTTKRDAMIDYVLQEHGIVLDDLKSSTVERMLDNQDLPSDLADLLRMRLQATTTSTTKYKALARAMSPDGRVRGLLQFDGAGRTGRWAGRLVQPQNFTRGTLKEPYLGLYLDALRGGYLHLVCGAPHNVMEALSSMLRGVFVSPPGRKLVVADLSNIEGRDQAWLAGEEWKLDAFRAFDRGEGEDLYKIAFGRSFNVDPSTVDKAQRQIGKVQELALGYAGGAGAFAAMALGYKVDLDEMAVQVLSTAPSDLVDEADDFLQWSRKQKRSMFGLSEDAFVACDVLKRAWRRAHPAIASYWSELEEAARLAILHPGTRFPARKLAFVATKKWLLMVLPSGRHLCYPAPRVEDGKISYMGIDQWTRQWKRISTHGGKFYENCIAKGTLVLTDEGWVPIEHIQLRHKIWDGESWVEHGGLMHSGKRDTITAHGVRMTPEHLVLTEKGWKRASESERYNRAPCRLPYSGEICRLQWHQIVMGSEVHLWGYRDACRHRAGETEQERNSVFLRVYEGRNDKPQEHNSWYVKTPGLCGMAQHAGSLQAPNASGVAQLWRTWHQGMSFLGGLFRQLLGGHGAYLLSRRYARKTEQQRQLRTYELPMAESQSPGQQYSAKQENTNALRESHTRTGGGSIWSEGINIGVAVGKRLAHGESSRADVYDILDCGPLHRFVVRGEKGPLIVHNCCQAVARDVMAENMQPIEDAGYPIVLSVHDELLTESEDLSEYNAEALSALLAAKPPWAPDMPLAAAGFEAYRYRKD